MLWKLNLKFNVTITNDSFLKSMETMIFDFSKFQLNITTRQNLFHFLSHTLFVSQNSHHLSRSLPLLPAIVQVQHKEREGERAATNWIRALLHSHFKFTARASLALTDIWTARVCIPECRLPPQWNNDGACTKTWLNRRARECGREINGYYD